MSKISQYTEAQSVDLQNVLPIVTGSVTKETKKVTVETLGKAIAKEQVYVELETESKNVIGAINELNEGGGGGGGHTILDNDGTSLTQRAELQFKGAYSEDNSTDEVTEVNVIRSMTKAEFDLLSNDEKVGIINVTDVTGGGENEFQPVIYSTTEREIGVWTDGKPLYEKSYPITNTNISTGWNSLINNVSDIDTFVSGECNLTDSSSYNYSWKASYHYNGNIAIYNFLGGAIQSANGYVTIRYTKTTDQAGSGTWTPQGVPAVHYSEDEQVVGTWIDGKTIYEKTVSFVTPSSNAYTSQNLDLLMADIDNIWLAEGYAMGTNYIVSVSGYTGNPTNDEFMGFIYKNNPNITFEYRVGSSVQNGNAYLTIRYTKTTT